MLSVKLPGVNPCRDPRKDRPAGRRPGIGRVTLDLTDGDRSDSKSTAPALRRRSWGASPSWRGSTRFWPPRGRASSLSRGPPGSARHDRGRGDPPGRGRRRNAARRAVDARRARSPVRALASLLPDARIDPVLAGLPPPRRRALEIALRRAHGRGRRTRRRGARPRRPRRVRAIARPIQALIVIDDSSGATRRQPAVLAFALRRAAAEPFALLAGVRTGAPSRAVDDIARALAEDLVDRIPVGPLSLGAIGRLVEQRTGRSRGRALLARVAEAAGGNPLLALEVIRAVDAAGHDPAAGRAAGGACLRRAVARGAAGPAVPRGRGRRPGGRPGGQRDAERRPGRPRHSRCRRHAGPRRGRTGGPPRARPRGGPPRSPARRGGRDRAGDGRAPAGDACPPRAARGRP